MKKHLLIIFVILSSVGFAQSKKERYTQLLGEMNRAQHRYDSIKRAYWTQHHVLENTARTTDRKIRELEKLEDSVKNLSASILQKTRILDDLGVDYSAILDKNTVRTSGTSLTYLRRLRILNYNPKDLPYLDTVHLKDLKIAKKNEVMSRQLVVLDNETKKCLNQIQVQKLRTDTVEKIDQEVVDMVRQVMDLNEKFSVADEQLKGKLKELEIAYLTKGPKGFSSKYANYFPLELEGENMDEPFGLVPVPRPESVQEPQIFEVVEEPASFPGGMEALKKYLSDNLVYPATAKKTGISGKVYLKFIVSDKGDISNVKIMRALPACPECDKEAARVVKNMPKWAPGKIKGKAVNSYYSLPITFTMQ